MTIHYKEDLLHFIWQFQLFNAPLYTLKGERVYVVSPGCSNRFNGPDFQFATIRIGREKLYGSVEIHRHSKEWYQHGHHNDTQYNNVILHVCRFAVDEVQRHDGTHIATVNLKGVLSPNVLLKFQYLMRSQAFVSCESQLKQVEPLTIEQMKSRMLTERLAFRFRDFEHALIETQNNWNEMVYRSFLIAFCKPYHHHLMEALGKRLNNKLILYYRSNISKLEALLLGCCGLIENQEGDEYQKKLLSEFEFLKRKHKIKELEVPVQTRSIRPYAQAKYKLVQLCAIFNHSALNPKEILAATGNPCNLFEHAELSPYWQTYFQRRNRVKPTAVLSNGQQNLLFVNFIEPFKMFYKMKRQEEHLDPLVAFDNLPADQNMITKKMRAIGIPVRSAACSQALLHLYKKYCKNKACLRCVIGKSILIKNHGTH